MALEDFIKAHEVALEAAVESGNKELAAAYRDALAALTGKPSAKETAAKKTAPEKAVKDA